MSVGIVIVTHGETAHSLLAEAGFILGEELKNVHALEFNHSKNPTSAEQIQSCVGRADSGDGVLVFTDLAGASPANMVLEALKECHAVMVTGVNLAMLIRACNYAHLPLDHVAEKAVEGGKRAVGIFRK